MARKYKNPALTLLDAAVIWHAATVINGAVDSDSSADKQLRRATIKYLKTGTLKHLPAAARRASTRTSPHE